MPRAATSRASPNSSSNAAAAGSRRRRAVGEPVAGLVQRVQHWGGQVQRGQAVRPVAELPGQRCERALSRAQVRGSPHRWRGVPGRSPAGSDRVGTAGDLRPVRDGRVVAGSWAYRARLPGPGSWLPGRACPGRIAAAACWCPGVAGACSAPVAAPGRWPDRAAGDRRGCDRAVRVEVHDAVRAQAAGGCSPADQRVGDVPDGPARLGPGAGRPGRRGW